MLQGDIVIIGAGFAGVWSALSAQRLIKLKQKELQVVVIAPEPQLGIRPRYYEANVSSMVYPLVSLFESAGIRFIQATVTGINTEGKIVEFEPNTGTTSSIEYKRLILAAGSQVARPHQVTGVTEFAFDVDTISSAAKLESHLESLASLPPSPARGTIVVCGGGFTGIELATELPRRLGKDKNIRITLVESADDIGPELGSGPRPAIKEALEALAIEVRLGVAVAAIDAEGVLLASGERIESKTAGMRATPLTELIPGPRDALSRLHVDQWLRVPSASDIYATGDAAYALADTDGHYALMSCQHALVLGRISGYNAAAELLGEPRVAYSQPAYNTCLDLGAWGAVVTAGWHREVKLSGDAAKSVKTFINQKLIYPPQNAEDALSAANPQGMDSDEILTQMLATLA
jgi:NADH dehydrogenase FAD-containing subunit